MEPEPSLVEKLQAAGIRSVGDLIYRLETDERSDRWVYITCDRMDDGSLQLIHATGFFPDEVTAGLAGETYVREWTSNASVDGALPADEFPPLVYSIPFFIESEMP